MVRFLSFLRFTALCAGVLFVLAPSVTLAKTVEELRAELNDKRNALKNTEQKIEEFKNTVQKKKQEARTLSDQIILIDDSIEEIELTLNRTNAEIEETDVEIEAVETEIIAKEEEIAKQKLLLADYIRSMHAFDQQSNVTVFLKYETFSEAMNETSTLSELQQRGQETLVLIQQLHEELTTKRRELGDFMQSLEALQRRQEQQQNTLANQRDSKQRILELTQEQEAQYQGLLQEAQQQHKQAQSSIAALDAKIREELKRQGFGNLPSVGTFNWPIEPIFGVSCEFHCSGYPYAYLIGPHSAIDIPTYTGTPIKAPADGYVARTFDSGGPGYSYIMLIHGDNLSTVYGHVSGFAVNEGQMVTRGTVIGYTGGASGARGSGLSTGPHLHFEVRKNNLPVNPRNFL
ncbi:MAG: peptidoglycan DD-metalloendopeptidase family protein [Candidatus Andersenbacteria bacterium]